MKLVHVLFAPWRSLTEAWSLINAALDAVLSRRRWADLLYLALSLIVAWHVYVPLHEMMHVLACWAVGGTVEKLALQPQYGAHLLKHIFPFIHPASDYAGQLEGFSVPSYGGYVVVVLAPFVCSLFGLACVDAARQRRSPAWLAAGCVLAAVPFTSIVGDYYEAVSLATTQLGEAMDGRMNPGYLVSDDVFKLAGELRAAGNLRAPHAALLAAGVLLAGYLALVTTALQLVVLRRPGAGRPGR